MMPTGDSGTHAEAAEWWRKGAEQGHGKGQHQLGFAYSSGDGVPGDDVAGWRGPASGNAEARKGVSRASASEGTDRGCRCVYGFIAALMRASISVLISQVLSQMLALISSELTMTVAAA